MVHDAYSTATLILIAPFTAACLVLVAVSIIQQRKMRALRQGEEAFRTVAENSLDLIFRYDRQGRRLYVNPAVARLFDKSVEELIGKSPVASPLLDSAQSRKLLDGILHVFETDKMSVAEVVFTDMEGQPHNHSMLLIPEHDSEGQVKTVLGMSRDITERKRMEDELANSQNFLDCIIEATADPIFVKDRQHRWILVNEAFCRIAGGTREELIGKSDFDFFPEDQARAFWEGDEVVFTEGKEFSREEEITTKGGEKRYIYTRKTTFNDAHGNPILAGVISDITARKRAEQALAARERELSTLMENIPDNIVRYTPDARYMYLNPVLERTIGKPRDQLLGRTIMECFPDGRYAEFQQRVITTAASGKGDEMEMVVPRADGEVDVHLIRFIPERDEKGAVVSVLLIGSDITPLKMHEQQLERIAHHDALTGLPNRLLFEDRLNQAVAQTRRAGGLLAVCFGDLDSFKPVNDQFGHEAGDLVLIKTAERMKGCLRAGDTVGRLGGDEFVVLLLNLESVEECEIILKRLLNAVAQPIKLDGHSVSVTVSLGVVLFPQDDVDPDTLLRHADYAMYQAKQSGANIYRFFEPDQP